MRYMTAQEIRETWLNFFKSKGHTIEPSASLIPVGDPTLLWINAGVAPLKKYFDGTEKPKSPRITNVQKSIRTNDIDNVGKTARHHTFFEMLGNFSIGDYFKEEAIRWGYELLTSEKWFGFPKEKLYITYYPDDHTARNIWIECGMDPTHLIPLESNFWEIGPGPSGPDTEIYFDRGEKYDKRGPELIANDINNDRYIEIWNIVFSQYNANPEVPRSEYKELPSKNIDTGAGLERFACVLQGTDTNFETDLHFPIILETQKLSGVEYKGQMAFKVISDHIKTLTFAISDGATLSNEGRGYVLRRILRRAIKYGRSLGFDKPFLYLLVDTVVEMMKSFYPSLEKTTDIVKNIIYKEEVKFYSTIADGEKHLLNSIKDQKLSGADAFKLYDTYGFPIELTLEYAEEHKVSVDLDGFKEELNKQKERSRQSRNVNISMKSQDEAYLNFDLPSEFIGYDTLQTEAKVIKVFQNGIVLDKTPFYATMGGQIKDEGTINGLVVQDVIKLPHGQFLHVIETESFEEGDDVLAIVDEEKRMLTARNHTATHLLHQAIKDVLGSHSHQQGSYNGPDKLTFDINHFESIKPEQILQIEAIVKQKINQALQIVTHVLPIEEAKKLGANMLFGEKYGDIVRVVDIDNWSKEFCGGTHVENTKDIKEFVIGSVESIGSGIYRFVGYTNELIKQYDQYLGNLIEVIDQLNKKVQTIDPNFMPPVKPTVTGSYQDVLNYRNYIKTYQDIIKNLEKTMEQQRVASILKDADSLIPKEIKEVTYIVTNDLPNASLKPLMDVLYDKMKTEVVVLINKTSERASILVKTLTQDAKSILKSITDRTSGNGGGKNDIAQGGTQRLDLLNQYLEGKL
jgi:alanyl-tRNA synthetase